MITLIIKSYFSIFMAVGLGALFVVGIGVYCIIKAANEVYGAQSRQYNRIDLSQTSEQSNDEANGIAALVALTRPGNANLSNMDATRYRSHEGTTTKSFDFDDMAAISGEDVLATQLDLAKALIETGKRHAAVDILNTVIAQGNHHQQAEAKNLLEG